MLAKGDLKFRLKGKKLSGDFALVKMKGRRPGSKGNEWLLIKKHDDDVVEGYDIDEYDESVISKRSMAEIAGDAGAAEWKSSRPASRGRLKAAWLADAVAKLDKKQAAAGGPKKKLRTAESAKPPEKTKKETSPEKGSGVAVTKAPASRASGAKIPSGATAKPMPSVIHPMLATPATEAFDSPDWLFEIKWDGYRAVAFIQNGSVRLVSRNQNDLTPRYPELRDLPQFIKAKSAIIDGEVVALDDEGRPSFSLMQQRTGFRSPVKRSAPDADVAVLYYAFDLLYIDGHDLRRVPLEERKRVLQNVIVQGDLLRYSDHYEAQGKALFEIARQKGLEGILAKRRDSPYVELRSRDWLKIKIRHRIECVIGGYTEPEGSRPYFGSVVLGLYDKKGRLIHVGQAGSGFDQKGLDEMWKKLQKRETRQNPFYGEVEALRKAFWVKPEMVAEIEFSEWTHGAGGSSSPKLRAPVFLGLRDDKNPKECVVEELEKSFAEG